MWFLNHLLLLLLIKWFGSSFLFRIWLGNWCLILRLNHTHLHNENALDNTDTICSMYASTRITYDPLKHYSISSTHVIWKRFLRPTLASWIMRKHNFNLNTKNTCVCVGGGGIGKLYTLVLTLTKANTKLQIHRYTQCMYMCKMYLVSSGHE